MISRTRASSEIIGVLDGYGIVLPDNDQRNRVATINVDVNFGVNRHSGSRNCSAAFL